MTILEIVGRRNGTDYGVLDTPCWPCRYYGGPLWRGRPGTNMTGFFFRTIAEARAHARRQVTP